MFIALEGLSGTGKTTVHKLLSEAIGAISAPSVPAEYAELRACFARREDLDSRFLYFLSAITRASQQIHDQLDAGYHVVVESYLARAVAFHRGMGSRIQVELPDLLQPDVTFQLYCENGERRRRIRDRGIFAPPWDVLAEANAAAITAEYCRFPRHDLDTTSLAPPEVVKALLVHPLDGSCHCADSQPLGHQDLFSTVHA